ncbi:MAG: hypothetical protein JWP87_5864 [Labilithrix sp.]|nr:hypothetical protein [Labilithrix sp.]
MKHGIDDAIANLDDYVRGHLPEGDVDSYEEDLFARALDDEAPELGFRQQLARTLQSMQARGTVRPWLTESGVAELLASGMSVRRFELDPANPTIPDLEGDFEILLTRIPVALEGVKHLDAEILTPDGHVLKVMPDIAFVPSENAIYACCERELARTAAKAKVVSRLWARDDHGRRLVAEMPSG